MPIINLPLNSSDNEFLFEASARIAEYSESAKTLKAPEKPKNIGPDAYTILSEALEGNYRIGLNNKPHIIKKTCDYPPYMLFDNKGTQIVAGRLQSPPAGEPNKLIIQSTAYRGERMAFTVTSPPKPIKSRLPN